MKRLPIVVVTLCLAACSGSETGTPTTPTVAPAPPPPPVAPDPRLNWFDGEIWNLTTTWAPVTGRASCFPGRLPDGSSVAWLLGVKRTGNTIDLDYDLRSHPTDDTSYKGTVSGRDFTAHSTDYPQPLNCTDGVVLAWRDIQVQGRFSEDGRSITAKEGL